MSQGVPLESHPTKLMGSKGYSNRFFDFEKLGEVCICHYKVISELCVLRTGLLLDHCRQECSEAFCPWICELLVLMPSVTCADH
jgi:hypothetical protein